MGDTAGRKGIGQGAHHGVLADQILEFRRTVFAGQHLVAGVRRGLRQVETRHQRVTRCSIVSWERRIVHEGSSGCG